MIALCSMWDWNYQNKGLALLASLRLHMPNNFVIVILALDDKVYSHFEQNKRPGIVALNLRNIETQDLLEAKSSRTWIEYIWTLTPHLTRFAYDLLDMGSIAYIDADCFLFNSLTPLYAEIGNAPVAIIPHRWTPRHVNRLRAAGLYNVSWVYFSKAGLQCLDDWREQCIEWCYWRVESDGRFADQGYLNDWPKKYGAHVVKHLGADLAPWNQEQYRYSINGKGLMISDGKRTDPILFYHFHGFNHDGKHTSYTLHPMIAEHIYPAYEYVHG